MRVHVTLKKDVQTDRDVRETALARILKVGHMQLANRKRFERYGITTGDADPETLGQVRKLAEVEAVEVEQERFATR